MNARSDNTSDQSPNSQTHVNSSANTAAGSVGVVTPQKFHFAEPLTLECNRTLPSFDLMVETYGTLNSDKSNAILICHALALVRMTVSIQAIAVQITVMSHKSMALTFRSSRLKTG